MENDIRFLQKTGGGAAGRANPRKTTSFDEALEVIWRVLRKFPEARQALQAALGELLKPPTSTDADKRVGK